MLYQFFILTAPEYVQISKVCPEDFRLKISLLKKVSIDSFPSGVYDENWPSKFDVAVEISQGMPVTIAVMNKVIEATVKDLAQRLQSLLSKFLPVLAKLFILYCINHSFFFPPTSRIHIILGVRHANMCWWLSKTSLMLVRIAP